MRRHRKCVVCGAAFPKNSSPRRAYCDGACLALAYRDRRKAARIVAVAVLVTRDEPASTHGARLLPSLRQDPARRSRAASRCPLLLGPLPHPGLESGQGRRCVTCSRHHAVIGGVW